MRVHALVVSVFTARAMSMWRRRVPAVLLDRMKAKPCRSSTTLGLCAASRIFYRLRIASLSRRLTCFRPQWPRARQPAARWLGQLTGHDAPPPRRPHHLRRWRRGATPAGRPRCWTAAAAAAAAAEGAAPATREPAPPPASQSTAQPAARVDEGVLWLSVHSYPSPGGARNSGTHKRRCTHRPFLVHLTLRVKLT